MVKVKSKVKTKLYRKAFYILLLFGQTKYMLFKTVAEFIKNAETSFNIVRFESFSLLLIFLRRLRKKSCTNYVIEYGQYS
jgi:hypothetical protein